MDLVEDENSRCLPTKRNASRFTVTTTIQQESERRGRPDHSIMRTLQQLISNHEDTSVMQKDELIICR
ncbi:MAG: hypothetical protein LQ351_003488 [Letrouitia transgressa]|nr:MAG: hypothetical protein LQ351_003488 [Letrouitia transgressa]